MRRRAIIDTGVLVGAFHRRDAHHAESLPIVLAADAGDIGPLVLTDFILAETMNFLVRKGGSRPAREALDRLEESSGFDIVRVSDSAYTRAKNDVFRRFDGLSFVDAITVAWMQDRNEHQIYSFDQGFDQVPDVERRTAV